MDQKPYKILGITSGRTMGNAEVMLRECLMACEKIAPVDVRITRLRTLKIAECTGCLECLKDAAAGGNGNCVMHDEFDWLKEQILWADAIIFSDPSFCYIPTSEVITMMNRAMGSGKDYVDACRAKPKYVGLICVGGSDTVDFNLPMQYYAMNKMCHGFELVDQFYADWVRGKGFIALQEHHLERARLQAKRVMNKLMGYDVPAIKTRILKLNPMEYKDDLYVDLEGCPVCHSAVVHMENNPFANGRFTCAICGATGHVEHHAGKLTYVWEDDSVAHNRLHPEFDKKYVDAYVKAHTPSDAPKAEVPEFPILTPDNDPAAVKPRIVAIVAGPKGGTSELLARKALAEATRDGQFEGAVIRINDLHIRFCVGCLLCKVNPRYRGGIDECVLKDDDLWVVDKLIAAQGLIYSLDGVNGFTYGKVISLLQRFGHGSRTRNPFQLPRAFGVMIAAFDDQVKNAVYATNHLGAFYANHGPNVAEELFPNVPTLGDGILANPAALGRAANVGRAVRGAAEKIMKDPANMKLIDGVRGMCPACGLNMIELHPDMSVSCAICDAHGEFQHRFGENNIVWDTYDVTHCRRTPYGGMLHFKHINYSQSEDNEALLNPQVIGEQLAPYVAYDKLVKPAK